MKAYLKLFTKHDITREININKEVYEEVFEKRESFVLKGKNSNYQTVVSFNYGQLDRSGGVPREFRFDSKLKDTIKREMRSDELSINEAGMIIVIFKQAKDLFVLDVIRNTDQRYASLRSLFLDNDIHLLITADDEFRSDQINEANLFPFNRLVIGAPGTGKSFKLKKDAECNFKKDNIERVTFHPAYMFAQFVGCYKPVSAIKKSVDDSVASDLLILRDRNKTAQQKYDCLYDKFQNDGLTRLPILIGLFDDGEFSTRKADGNPTADGNSTERNHGKAIRKYVDLDNDRDISYKYVPGPFIRTYERAIKNPNGNFLLIIEELNRANAPAVFGDIFQLLDRGEDGKSQYPVKTSEDLYNYLKGVGLNDSDAKNLCIPSNMYIWATMNSADQGVQPLDNAFKRRWNPEYIGIDGEDDDGKPNDEASRLSRCSIPCAPESNNGSWSTTKWGDFRKALNKHLLEKCRNVHEDRCIGPFFIEGSVIEKANDGDDGTKEFKRQFKSKLLMYLYEDVVKMNPKSLFDDNCCSTYSTLRKEYDARGLGIFKFSVNVNNDDKQNN